MAVRLLIALACGAVLLIAHGPVFSQEAPDTDGDGWTDGYEFHIGTTPASRCIPYENEGLIDAWPPDFNRDGFVDISDISAMARWFSLDVNGIPFYYRFDVSPEPMGDGIIDISDVVRVGSLFGRQC